MRREYKSSKWVKVRKVTQSRLPFLCWSRRTGYFVFLTYLLSKLLYVFNGCGQIFLMQYLLSFNDTYWGARILLDLHNNRSWHITKVSPDRLSGLITRSERPPPGRRKDSTRAESVRRASSIRS